MSEPSRAVFLSYASQDAEAARRIADALRAVGVEVWFDMSELRGGDQWDAKIRKQIAECALFVPIVSANTQARLEGYFRIEWKLAARRTHAMATAKAFLLPIVIDGTRDAEAHVPDEFRDVQWTRLPGGEAPEKFCARVQALLSGSAVLQPALGVPERELKHHASPQPRSRWIAPILLVLGAAVALAIWQPWQKAAAPVKSPTGASGPVTDAQRLVQQAKALIDSEPLATRETFRTAYELCENAAKLSPNDAEVWATMARANAELVSSYREGGEARVAATRSQAERAWQLAPDSIEAGLAMAMVDLELLRADPITVRTRLEGLLRRAPDDCRILLLLAQTEKPDAVSETAFRWLAQAEALPGGKARSALRQAWIYWGANRLRESLAAVERSLAAQPLTEAYHLKLMLLCTMGDSESALKWLKQIPPFILREDRPACIAYETYYFGRQPEEALRVLRAIPREIFEEGRYFEVRALLAGEALLMAGKPRAAEVEFRTALKVIDERLATEPRNSRLWHAKGRAQYHLGDRTAAESSFTAARELGGLRTIDLAIQCQLLRQTDETLALIDQALDRNITRWPSWLYFLKLNPAFDSLRGDVRFRQLIARAEGWLAEDLGVPGAKPAAIAPVAKIDDKSVAVLAFANLSDDKANEYFSDGISEELLNVLAKVPGLKVSARTSAFHFKGKDTPIPEIAKQLGVAYVVEGSVRKADDKVRITAQLIKAADGFHVWSDTFTRDLKDIFAVQDEIAGRIAKELSLKLGAATGAPSSVAVNPEAFELYVQARQAWNLRTLAAYDRAEELLNRALALEPNFARAHAALADVWIQRSNDAGKIGFFGQRNSPEIARLRAQVDRALALDPNLAEAHATLGNLLMYQGRFEESARELRYAITLNPNYATGHQWLGRLLQADGRFDEARDELALAAELDPFSPRILDNHAIILEYLGRSAEALPIIERALTLQPDSLQIVMFKATILCSLGRHDEAVALVRRQTYQNSGFATEAVRVLVRAGLKQEAEQMLAGIPGGGGSRALATIGRPADALKAMDPAKIHIGTFSSVFIDPAFDPIRQDPRYVALITELGMNEAHARARAWHAAHPLSTESTKK